MDDLIHTARAAAALGDRLAVMPVAKLERWVEVCIGAGQIGEAEKIRQIIATAEARRAA